MAGELSVLEKIALPMEKLVASPNIAKLLSKEQLLVIGKDVVEGYMEDRLSREQWEIRTDLAIKLAMQVVEEKSFPWPNCANVKFPLVTVAALQFLARMSILTKGKQIVKCDIIGFDPKGEELVRAKRIGTHMSYQLIEEDKEWINDDEKTKFAASIVGCAFKKSAFDSVEGINNSEYVPASNLVVDYFTKTLDKANRVTQVLTKNQNWIQERVRRGVFLELQEEATISKVATTTPSVTILQATSDLTQGTTRPVSSTLQTHEILEQHCLLDLDGDGYQEPYIVFVRSSTSQVLRIVARYFNEGDVYRVHDAVVRRLRSNAQDTDNIDAKKIYEDEALKLERAKDNYILRIEPLHYFTKYSFIPAIDGGFYDFGLGALLGPVNDAVSTLINQQLDAGTMQVTAGGFLGRGVKLKGGKSTFDPFEWKPVDSNGDDLRKNIVPLPVNPPSDVLFHLLGVLISYGEKISGATDIMTGVAPGQNTPAETSRNTIEQGMALFSGIYGRMHRAFKDELCKLYRLNQLYLDSSPKYVALSSGDGALITHDDYKKMNYKVYPAADVKIVSESQRQQKALMVKQSSMTTPGYDKYLAEKEFLEAFDVQGIDQLFPDPKGPNAIPPLPNPKLEIEKGKLELAVKEQDMNIRLAVLELQEEVEINKAKIIELHAKAEKLMAEANGVDVGHQIEAIKAQTAAAKAHDDAMGKAIGLMQRMTEANNKHSEAEAGLKAKGEKDGGNTAGSKGVAGASGDAGVSG